MLRQQEAVISRWRDRGEGGWPGLSQSLNAGRCPTSPLNLIPKRAVSPPRLRMPGIHRRTAVRFSRLLQAESRLSLWIGVARDKVIELEFARPARPGPGSACGLARVLNFQDACRSTQEARWQALARRANDTLRCGSGARPQAGRSVGRLGLQIGFVTRS